MKKVWNRICQVSNAVIRVYEFIEMNFMIWFTMIIGALIMLEIIFRVFQIQGSRWVEEVARYMLVTTTFIGSSIAVSQKGHTTMNALINALPAMWANVIEIITNLISGIGFGYIGLVSFQWTGKLIQTGKLFESISIPMWCLWAVISMALFTMGLRFLVQIPKNIAAIREDTYEATPDKEM